VATRKSNPALRRCADAFQCLGFNVTRLGQGKGRLPDLFALAKKDRFAILVDAKLRRDRYLVGTEDRKFFEYAAQCSKELARDGFDRLYFVIVSSSFQESDASKLNEYLTGSPVRRSSLITARALMRLVEDSIRKRSGFQLDEIENLISTTPLVST
jgi:hypothetical protein